MGNRTSTTIPPSSIIGAPTIFYNGNIMTMDANNTVGVGFVVTDRKISRLLLSELEVAVARATISKQIDLQGQTVMPGFVMPHSHLITYSILSQGITVSPMNLFFNPNYVAPTTSQEVLQILSVEVPKSISPSVFAQGYDPVLQPGPVICRTDLDTVSRTQAIYLMSASMHTFYVNTQALVNAGVVKFAGPDGLLVLNDTIPENIKAEVMNGVLCETAMSIVAASFPTVTVDTILYDLDLTSRILNRRGITTIGDATVPDNNFPLYREYSRIAPRIRIVGFPIFEPHSPWLTLAHGSPFRCNMREYMTNDYFFVGPVKMIADGSIEGYTAYLSQPYYTPPFFSVPDPTTWKGEPEYEFPKDEIQYGFEMILRSGYRIAIHGNGDAIIDDILDAFERAYAKYPVADHRTRIEHCTTVRPDQIQRMQTLGIHPSFMANHIYYYGDAIQTQVLGPDRAERIDPMGDIIANNMICDLHSDAPVSPPDCLTLAWIAANRLTTSGQCLGAEQRVSIIDALRMVTINAAFMLGVEAYVGSLEPGKFADFIVLGEDILTIDPSLLKDVPIVATYLGGELMEK